MQFEFKKSRIEWKVFVFSLYSVFPPMSSSQKDLLWPSNLYLTMLRWLPLDRSSHNLGILCILIHTECSTHQIHEGVVSIWPIAISLTPGIPPGTWTPTTNARGITEQVHNEWMDRLPVDRLNCDSPYCLLNVPTPPQTWGVRIARGEPGTLHFHQLGSVSDGHRSVRITFLASGK